MLFCTNLIFDSQQISQFVQTWNLLPLQYPYQFFIIKKEKITNSVVTLLQKNFCNFCNRFILFETRIFDNFSENHYNRFECLYWKNNKIRLMVKCNSRIFTVAMRSHSILHALSSALIPGLSWNLVPLALYNNLVDTDYVLVQFSTELIKRVAPCL